MQIGFLQTGQTTPVQSWQIIFFGANYRPNCSRNFGPTPSPNKQISLPIEIFRRRPKKIRRQGCFARTTFFVRLHFFRAHGMYNVATSPSFKVNNRIIKFLPTHSGLRQGYPGDGACSGIFGTKKCKRPAYVTARKKFIYGSNANKQLRNRGSFANGSFFERC